MLSMHLYSPQPQKHTPIHPTARPAAQAPVVVSACGSIHTPALLLRSGIKCQGNVGANLRLHPATCVVGVFPAQPSGQGTGAGPQPSSTSEHSWLLDMGSGSHGGGTIRPWEVSFCAHLWWQQPLTSCQLLLLLLALQGTLMSIFSNQVGDWERSGYGSLLYTPAARPRREGYVRCVAGFDLGTLRAGAGQGEWGHHQSLATCANLIHLHALPRPQVHPGLFASAAPWLGGQDFKELMLQVGCATSAAGGDGNGWVGREGMLLWGKVSLCTLTAPALPRSSPLLSCCPHTDPCQSEPASL